MKKSIINIAFVLFACLLVLFACKEEEYSLGELTAPQNLVINTDIVGQSAANPDGDGTGVVNITAVADKAIAYKVAYALVSDVTANPDLENMPGGKVTKKFTDLGTNLYRITVVAYGAGGSSTTATKDITVKSVYNAPEQLVTDLTANSSKTWKIDGSVAGHMGVGPWDATSVSPSWWSAAPNEKAGCCPCFYSARFTFNKTGNSSYTLKMDTPDGVFTKTGSLTTLPGIPSSGDEGCYPYAATSTSSFAFVGSGSGVTPESSTTTSIVLNGNNTTIGYGAVQKEFEILEINANYMHLRVRGTETGNAWYLKLIPAN